jgi:hypothetical protein
MSVSLSSLPNLHSDVRPSGHHHHDENCQHWNKRMAHGSDARTAGAESDEPEDTATGGKPKGKKGFFAKLFH